MAINDTTRAYEIPLSFWRVAITPWLMDWRSLRARHWDAATRSAGKAKIA